MTLQSSGAISIQDLADEFGGTVPHLLTEYTRFSGLVPLSISGDFEYGWASTSANTTTSQTPINIYYRRNIYQTIYTAAELTAAGVLAGANFTSLKWYIYGAVPANNSILGMNIFLFHTTASNGSVAATPVTGTSKVTVYSDSSTTEFTLVETTGEKTINFGGGSSGTASSSFTWDGVNNICVESCTSQNQTNYTTAGTQRIVNGVTNGGRFSRTDSIGTSCGTTPSSVASYKVSTSMRWSLAINETVPIWTGFPPFPTISLSMYYGTFASYETPAPPPPDLRNSFYEISNRFLDSQAYMGSASDYNGPYDVGEVEVDYSGSARVYIGTKCHILGSTFYGDIPIAGIQIVNSSGTSVLASWIFNSSTGGTGSTWQTTTSLISGTSTLGFPITPATAATYIYSNISTSTNIGRFSWATSTSSSYTGAADGISSTYSSTLAPVGNATVPQSAGTYYAYRETSGAGRYSAVVMRSPTFTFTAGQKIRVIHALTGPTNANDQMNPDDSLFVAIY